MASKVRSVIGMLIVLLFLSLTGGCSQYSFAGVDVHSYQVNEGNGIRLMHVVCIELHTIPQLTPLGHRIVLTPELPTGRSGDEMSHLYMSPSYRIIAGAGTYESISEEADELTYDFPQEAIRWIISTQPLVVGIGGIDTRPRQWGGAALGPYLRPDIPESEGSAVLGGTQALVRIEDLEQPVTALVVLQDMDAVLKRGGGRRVIRLPEPKSLGDIFKARQWE